MFWVAYMIGTFAIFLWALSFALCSDRVALPIVGIVLLTGATFYLTVYGLKGGIGYELLLYPLLESLRPLLLFGLVRWYRNSGYPGKSGLSVYLFLGFYSLINLLIANIYVLDIVLHLFLGIADILVTPLAMGVLIGFVLCRELTLPRALLTCTISALVSYLPPLVFMLIYEGIGFYGMDFLPYIGIFAGVFWILTAASYFASAAWRKIRAGRAQAVA